MLLKRLLPLFLLFVCGIASAQPGEIVQEYIKAYKELAMEEMKRTGVPASIKLAQGIHETMAGTSVLVLKSNNHFGIKCKSAWTGGKVYHDDDARGECFRSYASPVDSYRDHSDFLKGGQRYSFLFDMDPADYKGWAYGLKKAGYATNIKYSQIIIKLIEDYNLQEYSLIAMGRMQKEENIAAVSTPKSILKDAAVNDVEEKTAPKPSYPRGQFMINNTRVVFASGGTALLTIAQEYDVPLGRLLEFNDIKSDVLGKDQLVYLQRKRKTGANEFHVVQPGETLYDVCQVEGLRLESLVEYNHLQAYDEPAVGEKLSLRSVAQARPRLNDNAVK
ncbi:MAG: LysM peptidoglycan-binding domain-containing protein [Chitinophagaceae bacterium]|nr:MAG: LysM peptidoglycan-binding domain-containing protein [Chitinophagaceae bacterium]